MKETIRVDDPRKKLSEIDKDIFEANWYAWNLWMAKLAEQMRLEARAWRQVKKKTDDKERTK